MGGRVWAVWFDLVLSLEVIWGSRWVVGCGLCGLTFVLSLEVIGDQDGWSGGLCGLTLC